MKTFKRLTKENFIKELNDMIYIKNWTMNDYYFKNGLCYIGYNIGLNIVDSRTETKGDKNKNFNAVFKVVEDISNYDTIIKQFNLSNSIGVIKTNGYIIKDNFNSYRESIGLEILNTNHFNKLKILSGYRLTKDTKSFNRLKIK